MTARERSLYVYALAGPELPATLRVAGRSLRVLPFSGVAVIADARSSPPEATTDAVREQHDIVVALAERVPALLPARFGSLVTEMTLQSAIREHAADIRAALECVRGRRQMTVRVFGPSDAPLPSPSPRTGTEFLSQRRAQARHVPAEAAIIRQRVGRFVAEERVETAQPGIRVAVYHLVPIELVESYKEQASELQTLLSPHRVGVSGPWPAFAFTPGLL